jgi:hypothetical protein
MTIEPSSVAQPAFIVAPGLDTAIVDAHVDERDRIGRLMTFMARLIRQEGATGCAGGTPRPQPLHPTVPAASGWRYRPRF